MELRLELPTSTIEMNPEQVQFVSWLFLQEYSQPEFLVKAFIKLSGLKLYGGHPKKLIRAKWYKHKSQRKPFVLDNDFIAENSKRCEFLLTPEELKPTPWIKGTHARHYRLYNAIFEEYLMAENYYFAYIETKKVEHLDNLIACLYRKPWHRWNASKIQKRARQFRKVKPEVKNAVFMWYVGFRAYVPKRCKTLFSGKKSKRPFHPREYINGMVHQLNNGDITITNQLMKKLTWEALDELEQRAIDHELATTNN